MHVKIFYNTESTKIYNVYTMSLQWYSSNILTFLRKQYFIKFDETMIG